MKSQEQPATLQLQAGAPCEIIRGSAVAPLLAPSQSWTFPCHTKLTMATVSFWCCSSFSLDGFGPVSCVCSWVPDTGCEWEAKQALPGRRWGIAFNPLCRSQERAVSRSSTHNIKPKAERLSGYLAILWSSMVPKKELCNGATPLLTAADWKSPGTTVNILHFCSFIFLFSTLVLTSTFKTGRLSVWRTCNLQWFSHAVLYRFMFHLHVQCIQNSYLRPQNRGRH